MQSSEDPYDKFILQHLKHYGLFTGQSSSLQTNAPASKTRDGTCDSVTTDVIHLPATSTDMEDEEEEEEEEEEEPELHQGKYSFNVEKYLRTRQLLVDFEGGRPIPRLREPMDLFSIPSIDSPFQGVRWPVECEVIGDKIHHLEWEPPEPEPFYQQTGHERTPVPVGEDRGHTVYCIDSATKTSYFTHSRVGGSKGPLKSATFCARSQDVPTLSFESRFESGNLQKAVRVGIYDYELTLRNDMYTTKHTQWFYFRVSNMKAGVTYRFTIINLMKSSSLYEAGMRPLLYSEIAAWMKGEGWRRVGANIRYYRNHSEIEGKALYSLTWTLQFPYENDTCYLAHCYPYTYSDLQRYLHGVMTDPSRAVHCKVRVLCRSLAGNSVYVLTVTAPCTNWHERRSKRAVVVTARVHPGETNGSWMMQGFLDFLLGQSPDACLLRETFIFKVVPMLNPDGVVVGNYRCSLAGCDLNRNYRTLLRDSFPCVWYTRNMVKRLLAEREVVLYCDFHGHSRKNNVFMYGCKDRKDSLHLQERIFPLMMSKNATDKFSFRSCKFKIQKSKEGTGRIVMWRLGIRNSYTMESTFGGSNLGERKGTHFSIGDLKSMGYHLCDTLLDFCDPDQTKTAHCLMELEALLRQEIRKKLGRDTEDLEDLSDVDIESSTSGSNSTESDGLPVHLLNCTDQNIKVKKKHLRSRKERNKLRQQQTQKASSKILHRSVKHTDSLLSNEDLLNVRIQEKSVTAVKDMKEKRHNELVVRVHQSKRSWIPHHTTRIGVIDHETFWKNKPDKNPHFEAMNAAYFCKGDSTDSCQQHVSEETRETMCHYASCYRRQGQRLPLSVSAVRHRPVCQSSVPVQPLLFSPDTRGHPRIRGRYSVTNISLHRAVVTDHVQYGVVPEAVPTRGLQASHSAHFNPAHSLNKQKLRQKQTTTISFKYYVPEKQNTMGTLRINHKRNARVLSVPTAGLAQPDTEQSAEAEKLSEQEDILFFPDLRSIDTSGKSRDRPSGGLAGLGSLCLGKVPDGTAGQQMSGGDAASSGALHSEGRSGV
ncbi:cytosolic carboxypeptidase 2 isoform X2 [Brachyhypopomus gauderio]|uniref:cytosolic carboxypeptidase 2 isoform X2 n=1 Tax=Brachyhypopomus gauderio TaxID=698409 RepID=UPI004040F8AD